MSALGPHIRALPLSKQYTHRANTNPTKQKETEGTTSSPQKMRNVEQDMIHTDTSTYSTSSYSTKQKFHQSRNPFGDITNQQVNPILRDIVETNRPKLQKAHLKAPGNIPTPKITYPNSPPPSPAQTPHLVSDIKAYMP